MSNNDIDTTECDECWNTFTGEICDDCYGTCAFCGEMKDAGECCGGDLGHVIELVAKHHGDSGFDGENHVSSVTDWGIEGNVRWTEGALESSIDLDDAGQRFAFVYSEVNATTGEVITEKVELSHTWSGYHAHK